MLCIILDQRVKQIEDCQTTEFIHKILKGPYSEENITKIKNFYFNDRNLECEKTKWENVVHVSTFYLF